MLACTSTVPSLAPGSSEAVQVVLHVAELRVEFQPGRDAAADADFDLAERALRDRRTVHDLTESDGAVGRLRDDPFVRPIDGDRAVRRAHARFARDLADPGVAVRVLHRGGPVDAADPHRTGARDDLRLARGPFHGDGAETGLEVQGACLIELDVAETDLAVASADPTVDRATLPPQPQRAPATRRAGRSRRRSTRCRDAASNDASHSAP